mgnify:CR=1 FL=1
MVQATSSAANAAKSAVAIYGGYFNSDPSSYVADGYITVISDKEDYSYMVEEKTETDVPVEPEIQEPSVPEDLPDSIPSDSQGAVKEAAKGIEVPELEAAAATEANSVTKDQAAAIKAESSLKDDENAKVEVQAYLKIEPQGYDVGQTYTLDITPVYDLVVTSNTAGAQNDVIKKEQPLSIHGKTTVSIPLPEGFVNEAQDVYVQHKGYEYEAQVSEAGGKMTATFTNPHGFSAFTVTTKSAAVAEVNGNRYTSFQAAVDATGDNGTVKVLDANATLNATISGSSKTIYVENGTGENITVTIPESYAGAVMGDVSGSRGRVTGMDSNDRGETVVTATVPYAELVDYATRLRSLTRGTGDFTMEPAGYEQVPYDVQKHLVEFYEESRAQGR